MKATAASNKLLDLARNSDFVIEDGFLLLACVHLVSPYVISRLDFQRIELFLINDSREFRF